MHIEIDQSGHIEHTKNNTALAFSNGKSYSILIRPKTARACVDELRKKRVKPPQLQVRLFAAVLFFLLRDHIDEHLVILIDREYVGLDTDIKTQLIRLLKQEGIRIDATQIAFGHIGKKSPAHDLAIATFRGEAKPNRVISFEELKEKL